MSTSHHKYRINEINAYLTNINILSLKLAGEAKTFLTEQELLDGIIFNIENIESIVNYGCTTSISYTTR